MIAAVVLPGAGGSKDILDIIASLNEIALAMMG